MFLRLLRIFTSKQQQSIFFLKEQNQTQKEHLTEIIFKNESKTTICYHIDSIKMIFLLLEVD